MLKVWQKNKETRILNKYSRVVSRIHEHENTYKNLSNIQLRLELSKLKLQANGDLRTIMPQVFALVKEAAFRTLGLSAYDVQLMGAIALYDGKLAEMKTGEGKTLVIVFAAILESLSDLGVHVVTANDYLAERDCQTMAPVYQALGVSVGVTKSGMSLSEKKEAYACQVTYGVNYEFGFDYLRDNMVMSLDDKVQRSLSYAIVDEVDSILIDEARVPLIISGKGSSQESAYRLSMSVVSTLPESGWIKEEKSRQVAFTEEGYHFLESALQTKGMITKGSDLYLPSFSYLVQALQACLIVKTWYKRDRNYVVRNSQIVLVDDNTGRMLEGRRLGEGLHQALEALEGVAIQEDTVTQASITYQNYFRKYSRLAGLTGTAKTEEEEFGEIYGLEVVQIPPNKPNARIDWEDAIFATEQEKFVALVTSIKERHSRGQPVLVGTASIKSSEKISQLLTSNNLPHQLLNAKNHAMEASIIAQAGSEGAITVATNMAGRGTDIILGGNISEAKASLKNSSLSESELALALDELQNNWKANKEKVVSAGGLAVLGAERNDSRRVDNQLRGRSGRQGDPGESKFFLSFEDEMLKSFGEARLTAMTRALKLEAGESIESKLISRAIAKAQHTLENRNFDYRKSLMRFDGVLAEQREAYYAWRNSLLVGDDHLTLVSEFLTEWLDHLESEHLDPDTMEELWHPEVYLAEINGTVPVLSESPADLSDDTRSALVASVKHEVFAHLAKKVEELGASVCREIVLQVLDFHWREHLTSMQELQDSIYLRSFASKNIQHEFAKEAYTHFSGMRQSMNQSVLATLFHAVRTDPELPAEEMPSAGSTRRMSTITYSVRSPKKPKRLDTCSCGSGKKFKHCCGKETRT